VVLGQKQSGSFSFKIPADITNVVIIGVLQRSAFSIELFEIPLALIEMQRAQETLAAEFKVDSLGELRPITTFAKRL
jgi:hypothetical protein